MTTMTGTTTRRQVPGSVPGPAAPAASSSFSSSLAYMMLPLTRLGLLLQWGQRQTSSGGWSPTTTTTEEEEADADAKDGDDEVGGERPALPAGVLCSSVPSTTKAWGFFHGGGEAPPVSEEEEAEARVSSG